VRESLLEHHHRLLFISTFVGVTSGQNCVAPHLLCGHFPTVPLTAEPLAVFHSPGSRLGLGSVRCKVPSHRFVAGLSTDNGLSENTPPPLICDMRCNSVRHCRGPPVSPKKADSGWRKNDKLVLPCRQRWNVGDDASQRYITSSQSVCPALVQN
jgi:hypothetical protein